jgi:hypothetical protein
LDPVTDWDGKEIGVHGKDKKPLVFDEGAFFYAGE